MPDAPSPSVQLTPIEIATSSVSGVLESAPPLPAPEGSPYEALEAAVLPAVARPPCVVTFSGGRDSSIVLAAAASVARREGLPDPIAVTIDFVGIEAAEESEWQRMVIDHVGIEEWERRPITTELDRLGSIITRALAQHGLLWPLNCYVHQAVIDTARGGSLLTGMFGDSIFGGGRWLRANQVLAGRERPVVRDGLRLGLAMAPRRLRQRVNSGRIKEIGWLRPEARAEYEATLAASQAAIPRRYDRWIDWYAARRSLVISNQSMATLGEAADVLVGQPLGDPGFHAALKAPAPTHGFGNRTDIMRALFEGALPDEVLARPDKAIFGDAFRGEASREFMMNWDGRGVDTNVVDPEALQRQWRTGVADGRTTLLLHQVWLNTRGVR